MKVRSVALLVASVLALLPASSGAVSTGTAANGNIVAGPGGFISPGSYATPVVTVPKGTRAVFHNADIALHDVISVSKKGKKPLFSSKLIGLGQSAPVARSEKLPVGDYVFFCSKHHWMQGRLVVI